MVYCADQERWGIRIKAASSRKFPDVVTSFSVFVVRESVPYIRLCKTIDRSECKGVPTGKVWPTYLSDARKLYADDYTGSLTIAALRGSNGKLDAAEAVIVITV